MSHKKDLYNSANTTQKPPIIKFNYLIISGLSKCRGDGIRTHDPLLPKQVR